MGIAHRAGRIETLIESLIGFRIESPIGYWIGPLVLLLAASPLAFAHALLVRSTPANGSVVHSRQIQMTLEYNSRIEQSRCTLTLTNGAGQTIPLQKKTASGPAELQAVAQNLANGTYQLHWQVLASDGHITRGQVAFTVAVP